MAKVFLRKTRESRVHSGHPWVFLSDTEKVEGDFTNGDVVDVVVLGVDEKKKRISLSIRQAKQN